MSAHGSENLRTISLQSTGTRRGLGLKMPSICIALFCLFGLGLIHGLAPAQDVSTSESLSAGTVPPNPLAPSGVPPMGGGGSMADYSTLMMLIEQTIDPDGWLAAGGRSTQIPYPSGVYVDPRGHLRRMRAAGAMPEGPVAISAQGLAHLWRAGKELRTISLKQLDRALADLVASGLQPTRQMQQLAGISRIQYVAFDVAQEDILIAGPVHKGAEGTNGFLMEDLITLARLVSRKTVPLGCSIDPTPDGLLRANELLSDPSTISRLSRSPKAVADQLKAAVGPQSISVFGLDSSSSTALALVDVDEHMKRVGLGLAKTTPRIKTYFDHLNSQSSVPSQSLIRWWFSYSPEPIAANVTADVFELPAQSVAVLSQQQWIDQQGDRQPTGAADRASDAFAKGMSEQLGELRITHPAYARLHGIFELGLAMQLAVDAAKQDSLAAWLPTICESPYLQPEPVTAPKTVDGLTTWHRLRSGTIVAVISGGVEVDATAAASKQNWLTSNSIVESQVKPVAAKNSIGSTNWWQD